MSELSDRDVAFNEVLEAAASAITSDWGEPLKDAEIPDGLTSVELDSIIVRAAAAIRGLKKK